MALCIKAPCNTHRDDVPVGQACGVPASAYSKEDLYRDFRLGLMTASQHPAFAAVNLWVRCNSTRTDRQTAGPSMRFSFSLRLSSCAVPRHACVEARGTAPLARPDLFVYS